MASSSRYCRSVIATMKDTGSINSLPKIAGTSSSHFQGSSSLLLLPPVRRAFSTSLYPAKEDAFPLQRQVDSSKMPPIVGSSSATSTVERTLRRFWKKVDVAYYPNATSPYPHLRIRLDGRSLKTPSGTLLAIPGDRPLLASLIAREWAEQEKILKMHSLPMTSLAARAIDGLEDADTRGKVCDELIKYLETETICFHETHPPILVQLQNERWDPILSWTSQYFYLPPIKTFGDVLGVEQDEEIVTTLRRHIATYDAWDLSAFERIVRTSKSFLISIRLMETIKAGKESDFGVREAAEAAEVEVESQTQRWGQVEDTHDVDHADLRKTLASVACAIVRDDSNMAKQVANETITS